MIEAPTVTVFFGLTQTGGDFFTIEDPVKGALDTGLGLAGDVGVEIQSDSYDVTVVRGRLRELDYDDPGRATIAVFNHDRHYDPSYAAGPYFGDLTPGKKVTVAIYGQTIYDGTIEDIENQWSVNGDASTVLTAEDALGQLGRKEFDEWTTIAGETAGPRLTAVLNRGEVNFGINRDFDPGVSTLQGDLVSWGSNVLNYCQLVAASDMGRFFASRQDALTFRDRHSTFGATPKIIFRDAVDVTDSYLTPTVGTVTSPDPGPLPNECVFVFKVRSSTARAVVAQWETAPSQSWLVDWAPGDNVLYLVVSADGTAAEYRYVTTADPSGQDEYRALSVQLNNGSGRLVLTERSSSDGTVWQVGATRDTGATVALFDSASVIRIGDASITPPFDGRIYSVELRTGLDPVAGTVIWRFDADDFSGTGTSYVDPRGRTWTLTDPAAITLTTDVPFHGITTANTSAQLFNRVGVDREGGELQTVGDTTSQDEYGIRSLVIPGLLQDDDEQSLHYAEFLWNVYKDPQDRITSVTVFVSALSPADRALVSSIELGNAIRVVWTPRNIGDPLDQLLSVEGIEHSIPVNGVHTMTMRTSLLTQQAVFIVEDSVFGALDTGGGLAF